MKSKIINHIRAGHPGLYLVSPEEQRVEAEMHQIARTSTTAFISGRLWMAWSIRRTVKPGKPTTHSKRYWPFQDLKEKNIASNHWRHPLSNVAPVRFLVLWHALASVPFTLAWTHSQIFQLE